MSRTLEFYVGQRVRIRSVEDMEREFGVAQPIGIGGARMIQIHDNGPNFNKDRMSALCGMTAEIVKLPNVYDMHCDMRVYLKDWLDSDGIPITEEEITGRSWNWSLYMIEPAETNPVVAFDAKQFEQMLGVPGGDLR